MRLNKERQDSLEPSRLDHSVRELTKLGFNVDFDDKKVTFEFNGSQITFFPYTGWASGKTIKDGRGLNNLLKQLK